jgi:hypothetical protein
MAKVSTRSTKLVDVLRLASSSSLPKQTIRAKAHTSSADCKLFSAATRSPAVGGKEGLRRRKNAAAALPGCLRRLASSFSLMRDPN